MPKKKAIKKKTSKPAPKASMNRWKTGLIQGIAGMLAGFLLSAILSLIIYLSSEVILSFFSAFLLSLTIYFIYPIGVFIGVLYSGKYLKSEGIIWSALTGLFVSVILFIVSLFYIESAPWPFWLFTVIVYPVFITLGYYRFGFKMN